MTLCPTSRWLELAANAYPCMSSFVDIGSNKGHTGASFFGLWAREASGLRGVHHWWQLAYNSSQSHCGYCRDCLEIDRARLVNCTENTAAPTQLHTIQVHSFDGSRSLVNHIRTSASRWFPRLRENWSVHWGVVSNRSGMATFAQGPGGAETSHIIDPSAATDSARQKDSRSTFEQVRVWTVDEFARAHGLQSIDVLKIDAEGHDPMVVYGSRESLHTRRIKLLFFEHNMFPSWVNIRLESIVVELEEAGYVCYLGGEVAMVRLTGCWGTSGTCSILRLASFMGAIAPSESMSSVPRSLTLLRWWTRMKPRASGSVAMSSTWSQRARGCADPKLSGVGTEQGLRTRATAL